MNRIEQLLSLCKDSPKDTFILYALALEYVLVKDWNEAEIYFLKCKEVDENYLALYYHYRKCLESNNNKKLAIDIYKQGIALAEKLQDFKTKSELEFALEDLED